MANTKVSSEQIIDDVALGGNPTTTTQSAGNNTTRVATTAFVTTAVANLVDSAPSSLNTLNELAAAMNDNASFFSTVLPLSGGTMSGALNMGSQNITNAGTITGTTGTFSTASSGATAATGTVLTVEDDDNTTLSILGGSSSILAINFGHSGDNDEGTVSFNTTSGSENLELTSSKDITYKSTSTNSTAGHHIFKSFNTEIMRIDGGNNRLGIGTNSPQSTLQVATSTGTYSHFGAIATTDTHYTGISLGYTENANATYRKTAIAQEQIGDGAARGHLHFLVDIANDSNSVVLADSKMMIHGTSGDVGIGTTSPTNNLHIHTDSGDEGLTIKSTGNTSNAIIMDANRSGAGSSIGEMQSKWNGTTVAMIASATGDDTTNKDDGKLVFYTSSANNLAARLTIDQLGRETNSNQPYVAAYRSSNQTVSAATWTDWSVDTTLENNGSDMRTATSTFTMPVAGVYLCTGVISIQQVSATNYALARVVFSSHNDVELGIFEQHANSSNSTNDYGYDVPINFMFKAVASETMKVQTFSGSGTHVIRGGAASHIEIMLMR